MAVYLVDNSLELPRWAWYGSTRIDGYLGPQVPHAGVDVPAPPGSAFRAWGDGTVVQTHEGKQGHHILVEYDDYWTWYLHSADFTKGQGSRVKREHVLGHVSPQALYERNRMMPPHIHIQCWSKELRPERPTLPLSSILGTIHPNAQWGAMKPSHRPAPKDARGFPFDCETTQIVNFRATPRVADNVVGVLPPGSRLRALEAVNGWLLVRRATNQAKGYVSRELVRRLEP